QVDADVAVVLQREDVMVGFDDANTAGDLDVSGRHGTSLALGDAKNRLLDVVRQRERQRLEIPDDLVNVLDNAGNGLVLVDDAVDPEAPDGGPAEGREQHAPHRVAQGVAEAALE